MKKKKKPTAREVRFAEYILQDLSQAGAYKKAGYKAKNGNVAAVLANRLLRKDKVAENVARRRESNR